MFTERKARQTLLLSSSVFLGVNQTLVMKVLICPEKQTTQKSYERDAAGNNFHSKLRSYNIFLNFPNT